MKGEHISAMQATPLTDKLPAQAKQQTTGEHLLRAMLTGFRVYMSTRKATAALRLTAQLLVRLRT